MEMIARFKRNPYGRDLIVGDIHGHFDRLNLALAQVGFDRKRDRLFAVGDLVDRGPHSDLAVEWLDQPWFFSVQGNHEQMAAMFAAGAAPADWYAMNGGHWFIAKTQDERDDIASRLVQLPFVIEIETDAGLVGIVHAACDYPSWDEFKTAISEADGTGPLENAIWGRDRIGGKRLGQVAGVRAVVVGHTPVLEGYTVIDNVYHIDTGGWLPRGRFTLLDAATLQPATAP